jgi:uncharacterized membrane protein
MKTARIRTRAAAATLISAAAAAHAQPTFCIEEMPPLPGGNRSLTYGIAQDGMALGASRKAGGGTLMFPTRWINGAPEELIIPPPPGFASHQGGYVHTANAAGSIVGDVLVPSGGYPIGFVWHQGVATFLPLPQEHISTLAISINSAGTIVGYAWHSSFARTTACRWDFDGQVWMLEVLPPPPGINDWLAEAIDENGVIYGTYWDAAAVARSCKWEGGNVSTVETQGLPSRIFATSPSGTYQVGRIIPGAIRAMLHDQTSAAILPTVPGFNNCAAFGVNDHGTAVGWGFQGSNAWAYDGSTRAAIWMNGAYLDPATHLAPTANWTALNMAWRVNTAGQIAGWGTTTTGHQRGFVLTPCGECYANCDESTTAPILNVDDFTCFINEFAQAQSLPHAQQLEHYANCDQSTIAPALNVDDFTCFINQYGAGCP